MHGDCIAEDFVQWFGSGPVSECLWVVNAEILNACCILCVVSGASVMKYVCHVVSPLVVLFDDDTRQQPRC